jgi:hypothetical protein
MIREGRAYAVVSTALLEEYRRQARMSKFFRRWLAWMTRKQRVWEVNPPPHRSTRSAAQRLLSAPRRDAVEKDLHLVSAALASDRRVLSEDDLMRRDLGAIAPRVRALARVHWANPEAAGCILWLSLGAPDDRAWQLA